MTEDPRARRFRQAVELADTGLALMGQNLRRRHPEATEEEVEQLLRRWLADRPLDAPGRQRR